MALLNVIEFPDSAPSEMVHRVLEKLPPKYRTCLVLREYQDMSCEEIAEVLGCSLSATKSLIHRGRETLKERLKAYLRTGAWQGPK